jgi:AcrR family transcriptional regulator
MPARAHTAETTDGRRQRADNSRVRIAVAMLELLKQGELEPSADRVAEQAQVGRRTVFRLFDDMDGVYREMHTIMLARVEPIFTAPITGTTWRERLADIVERRARVFEEILPVKTGADAMRHRSAFLAEGHAAFVAMQRKLLRATAPKNISSETLEALELTLSFEAWRRLRREQKLSVKAATGVLHHMTEALA